MERKIPPRRTDGRVGTYVTAAFVGGMLLMAGLCFLAGCGPTEEDRRVPTPTAFPTITAIPLDPTRTPTPTPGLPTPVITIPPIVTAIPTAPATIPQPVGTDTP